jgi:hypothetical protein
MAAMSGAWLRKKVRHPWLGGPRRLTMYLATLDCATSNPSLSSSPYKDNEFDISDLKNVTLTFGDLRAIVTLLEWATAHLLLPDEATKARERLQKLYRTELL